jgi:hypothetical protein
VVWCLVAHAVAQAFAAFSVPEAEAVLEPLAAVATGNWGCGIFGGDPAFKVHIYARTHGQPSVSTDCHCHAVHGCSGTNAYPPPPHTHTPHPAPCALAPV